MFDMFDQYKHVHMHYSLNIFYEGFLKRTKNTPLPQSIELLVYGPTLSETQIGYNKNQSDWENVSGMFALRSSVTCLTYSSEHKALVIPCCTCSNKLPFASVQTMNVFQTFHNLPGLRKRKGREPSFGYSSKLPNLSKTITWYIKVWVRLTVTAVN